MIRSALCALLCWGALPAAAQYRGAPLPATGLASPIVAPAPAAWAGAFDAFASWLNTPSGRVATLLDPGFAGIANIHPDARRVAVGPLASRLEPGLSRRLLMVGTLPAQEQLALARAVSEARASAAPEARAAALSAWAAAKPAARDGDLGELRGFTEQLKGMTLYGPEVREAYRAAKRTITERAMRSARGTASSLLPPVDWDSDRFDEPETRPEDSRGPAPSLLRLRPAAAAPSASFYDAGHWRKAAVPDRRYARRLDAAAHLLGSEDRLDGPRAAARRRGQARLLDTIRSKDGSIYSHLMRVGLMAGLIAWRMGFSMEYAQRVAWGARVHDIGKREDEILAVVNKPGTLTPEERLVMERHPAAGAEIVEKEAGLDPLSRRVGRRAALSHHETLDGAGYPNKLVEGQIPMEARITAVADFLDALMEHRPYRPGLTLERALAIMEPQRAKFDPAVWAAFRSLVVPSPAPAPAGAD